MERSDWLDAGYDPEQARFLMMTAMTNHRFSAPGWGEDEIRSLHAELAEIDAVEARILETRRAYKQNAATPPSGIYGLNRRSASWPRQGEQEASLARSQEGGCRPCASGRGGSRSG